jgi:diguanylate cyclase (GGDEF)-like protein/PAS domain S-box-containing protein
VERLGPVLRISFGLALLACSILLGLDVLGLVPTPADRALEGRMQLCETLAAQAGPAIERNDLAAIRAALQVATRRHDEVLSAALRGPGDRLLVAVGDHQRLWHPEVENRSTSTHVRIPLFRSGERWGTIEVRFESLAQGSFLAALWERPLLRLVVVMGVCAFIGFTFYMRRTLRHLDPSSVVPARVQATLDVMSEGVILIDDDGRVVLANTAFVQQVGRAQTSLLGADAGSLGWAERDSSEAPRRLPWLEAVRESRVVPQTPLVLNGEDGERRSLMVKASPVLDGWGRAKGAVVTFHDVTELERKSAQLERALAELEKSQDEIQLQNDELRVLANTDALTGVANRRSFMESRGAFFRASKRDGELLSCVMADIDHFKRVNDQHGHQAGDEVLRRVSEAFAAETRTTDEVCRYGGEEFCIVLPGASSQAAAEVAERIRKAIASPGFSRVPVTLSFGVASLESGARTFEELIKQADDALYLSKERGRDRVTRWDQCEPIGS